LVLTVVATVPSHSSNIPHLPWQCSLYWGIGVEFRSSFWAGNRGVAGLFVLSGFLGALHSSVCPSVRANAAV
jgi:hypothetical protein